jgi:hypothetical protein
MQNADPGSELIALTVQALLDADEGFNEFERRIECCCTAFEDGNDSRGHTELAGLVAPLGEFARFCSTITENCRPWLSSETAARLADANRQLQNALRSIVAEAEDRNCIGIGDACRIDLAGALYIYRKLFPQMAAELKRQ